jgi:hypothetical protein
MAKRRKDRAKPTKSTTRAKNLADAAREEWHSSGLCAEGQADGVPCAETGKKCEECEKADAKFSR